MVERRWSSRCFKLQWSVRTRNSVVHRYGRQSHSLDEADELPLISRELGVLRSHRPAEEGDQALALVKNSPKAQARGVAVHDEGLGEVRQLEDWRGRQGTLEAWKAAVAASPHWNASRLRRAVSGAAMTP